MAKRPTARARASRASHTKISSSSSSSALANLRSDYTSSSTSQSFSLPTTKKDKRHIRRGQLLAKVREGGISKADRSSGSRNGIAANGKSKTRRPSKKLKTELGEMADALDDVEMEVEVGSNGGGEKSGVYAEDEWEGVSETSEQQGANEVGGKVRRRRRRVVAGADASGKMVMKSLRHRPGSMKRKKVLEAREMERFQRNLAELAKAEGGDESGVGGRGGDGSGEGQAHIQQRWKALRAFIGGTMQKDKAFEVA